MENVTTASYGKETKVERPILLTVSAVARQLSLSESMVYALIKRGELVGVRIGTAVRIRQEDVNALIQANLTNKSFTRRSF